MKPMRGKAWVFFGVLDVDWEICPREIAHRLQATGGYTKEELRKYCMTNVDPHFPNKVHSGDLIVAEHMGFGHDHDHASLSILGAGVAAVICETSGPYFLRNSIERGLPVVEIPGVLLSVHPGEEIEVDLESGRLSNLSTGAELTFEPMPAFLLQILEAGGMIPFLKRELDQGRLPRRLEKS